MKERDHQLRVTKREEWRKSGETNASDEDSDEESETEEETEKEKKAKLRSAEVVQEYRAIVENGPTNRNWYRNLVAFRKAQEARDAVHLLHLLPNQRRNHQK
jgi:hypothetical protein